jgi:cytochrome c oxidase cbb3-type subunit 4
MDALMSIQVWSTVASFVVFLGILVWALSRRRARAFEEAALLPFGEKPASDDRERAVE